MGCTPAILWNVVRKYTKVILSFVSHNSLMLSTASQHWFVMLSTASQHWFVMLSTASQHWFVMLAGL
jgi:hypothetical protein